MSPGVGEKNVAVSKLQAGNKPSPSVCPKPVRRVRKCPKRNLADGNSLSAPAYDAGKLVLKLLVDAYLAIGSKHFDGRAPLPGGTSIAYAIGPIRCVSS